MECGVPSRIGVPAVVDAESRVSITGARATHRETREPGYVMHEPVANDSLRAALTKRSAGGGRGGEGQPLVGGVSRRVSRALAPECFARVRECRIETRIPEPVVKGALRVLRGEAEARLHSTHAPVHPVAWKSSSVTLTPPAPVVMHAYTTWPLRWVAAATSGRGTESDARTRTATRGREVGRARARPGVGLPSKASYAPDTLAHGDALVARAAVALRTGQSGGGGSGETARTHIRGHFAELSARQARSPGSNRAR